MALTRCTDLIQLVAIMQQYVKLTRLRDQTDVLDLRMQAPTDYLGLILSTPQVNTRFTRTTCCCSPSLTAVGLKQLATEVNKRSSSHPTSSGSISHLPSGGMASSHIWCISAARAVCLLQHVFSAAMCMRKECSLKELLPHQKDLCRTS